MKRSSDNEEGSVAKRPNTSGGEAKPIDAKHIIKQIDDILCHSWLDLDWGSDFPCPHCNNEMDCMVIVTGTYDICFAGDDDEDEGDAKKGEEDAKKGEKHHSIPKCCFCPPFDGSTCNHADSDEDEDEDDSTCNHIKKKLSKESVADEDEDDKKEMQAREKRVAKLDFTRCDNCQGKIDVAASWCNLATEFQKLANFYNKAAETIRQKRTS